MNRALGNEQLHSTGKDLQFEITLCVPPVEMKRHILVTYCFPEAVNEKLAFYSQYRILRSQANHLRSWCCPTSTLKENVRFVMKQVLGDVGGKLSLTGKNGKPSLGNTRLFTAVCGTYVFIPSA